ncbi:MAG: sulfatase [Planctomycetota bacterium]
MREPRTLLIRIGVSLALFDVLMTFLGSEPPTDDIGAMLGGFFMPFAFYGLVYRILAILPSPGLSLLSGLVLMAGRLIYSLIPMFLAKDAPPTVMRFGLALVVMAAVMFGPWPKLDRIWKWSPAVAIGPGLLGLFLVVSQVPSAFTLDPPENKAEEGSPNLILLSWDTIRADVLTLYGGLGLDTPNLDALAARGIVFNDAVALTPITGPEHATMLTGVYPPSHGLRANMLGRASDGPETLPSQLRRAGYRTGGFISAFPLVARFGFNDSFEHFDDRLLEDPMLNLKRFRFSDAGWINTLRPIIPNSPNAYSEVDVVQKRATDWLETIPAEDPYFLFLHFYDAHAPFTPREPYRSAALAKADISFPDAVDPKEEETMDLYRAEIAMLDDYLGRLMPILEERDPGLANTLIILTSDHGECFGEGGIVQNHVPSLYEATQHVPMIVHLPGGEGAGTRVDQTVCHLDIVPTFLKASGLDLPEDLEEVQSYPLQNAIDGTGFGDGERLLYLEAQQFKLLDEKKQAWRGQNYKLVQWENGHQDLWKFRENEVDNLAEAQPELAETMLATMRAFFEELPKATGAMVEMSKADMSKMSALGYTGDDEEPPENQ